MQKKMYERFGEKVKAILKYLKEYKWLLIIGPFFKLVEAVLELFLPYFMSLAVDHGVLKEDKSYVIKMGITMLITATIGIVSALICQYTASIVSQGFGTKLRNAMFDKIMSFSNTEIDDFGTTSLVNRLTSDVNQLQTAVAMLIRLVIRAPFLCIGGVVMAVSLDIKLSVVLMVVLPMFIIVLAVTMIKTVPLYKKVQQKLDQIALVVRENLAGVRVIRAFSKVSYEEEKFENSNEEYAKTAIRVGKISSILNPLTNLIMNLAICAILWIGGIRVNSGSMSVGSVIAFINYVTQILAALIIVSNLVVLYTKAFASLGRVAKVLNTEVSIKEGEGTKEKESDYAVEFENVTFYYEGTKEPALTNINLKVKKGETVGIIGGTGSGKSTLIQLIPRFYDTTTGKVKVNGLDVKEYKGKDLIHSIGMVPQKCVLFTGSILENLRWGDLEAKEEQVKKAAEIAQASEFIEKMPEQYHTILTQGGTNVSGGQRQRLTIARALVKEPDILILDDSFNALDFVTDANLRKALHENLKGLTTFIISQRASTIRNSDQIVVLHDGEMVGIGKHHDLMKDCEVYREICLSQEREEGGDD